MPKLGAECRAREDRGANGPLLLLDALLHGERLIGRDGQLARSGDLQKLAGIDPVRIFDDVGVDPVDLGPQEGIGEIRAGEIPERVTFLHHVRATFGRLLRERDRGNDEGDERGPHSCDAQRAQG